MSENDTAPAAEPTAENDNVRPIREDVERSASLEIIAGQKWWTAPQLAALQSIGLGECPDPDRMAFLHLCQSTGLDPFRREIYLLGRKAKVNNQWTTRWTPQTGIDGFRHLAEETGVYGGRVGPQWAGEDGAWRSVWLSQEPPRAARVGVVRTDRPHLCRECGAEPGGDAHGVEGRLGAGQHVFDDERITWAVAVYDEYVPLEDEYAGEGNNRQKTGNKVPTSMWRKMPSNQLAKCAEAAAVRAAFPRRAAGLYEHAEMDAANQASKEVEEAERDRQRRELVSSRTWARGPGGDAGVVLDPDAAPARPEPTYDRTVLLAELAEQARAADKTISQYTTRWAAAHKKNIDDATDAELEEFLAARRGPESAAAPPGGTEGPGEHGLTVHDQPRPQEQAPESEGGEDTPAPEVDGQASLDVEVEGTVVDDVPLHDFDPTPGNESQCLWCEAPKDDATAHLG